MREVIRCVTCNAPITWPEMLISVPESVPEGEYLLADLSWYCPKCAEKIEEKINESR